MWSQAYTHWWNELGLKPLAETRATCASCTMAHPPQNETLRDPGPFSTDLKCCTYFPFIPNFSIAHAASLRGEWSAFVDSSRDGLLSPLGLFPPSEAGLAASNPAEVSFKGFGTDAVKKCPFLIDARCSIWAARPSVCASYFCVSSHGRAGLDFWSRAEDFGNKFEWTAAHLVLWRAGFTSDETDAMLAAVESGSQEAITASWLEWRGREHALYVKLTEISRELRAHEVLELMGDESIEGLQNLARNSTPSS